MPSDAVRSPKSALNDLLWAAIPPWCNLGAGEICQPDALATLFGTGCRHQRLAGGYGVVKVPPPSIGHGCAAAAHPGRGERTL